MFMKQLFTPLLAMFMAGFPAWATSADDDSRPNVLFIAIDDMNDWVGFLKTHPQVKTPNMDALAERGISFTNAHAPAPVCGPSRTAIMSGVWPTTNGIYANSVNYDKQLPNFISMPQYFRQNDYKVMGVGKIFHGSGRGMPEDAFDEYGGGSNSGLPFSKEDMRLEKQTPFNTVVKNGKTFKLPLNGIPADRYWRNNNTFDWGPVDLPDDMFSDGITTSWAINKLKEKQDKPFFLAVGFTRPHQPLYNPKRFHDLYPLDEVILPQTIKNDVDDLPRSGKEYTQVAVTSGLHRSVEAYGEWENATASYLASISFVDELVGNILKALEESEYADNTMIVLWSDNGWHLGEKEHWGKATGWYRSTRVPLLIIPAKNQKIEGFKPNSESARMVNLLDLAPTIADMTNVPINKGWQGQSLLPLVKNPNQEWQGYTHTTVARGNHTITTPKWQYIHYFDGSEELYDLERDPDEFNNLASKTKYTALKAELFQHVPTEPQWKYFIRYHNFKAVVPADGAPMTLHNTAYQTEHDELTNVAKDYPHIVRKIEKWLAEKKPTTKYLSMAD